MLAKDVEFFGIFAVLEFLPDQLAIKRIARFSSRNQCDQLFSLFHRCPIYEYTYIHNSRNVCRTRYREKQSRSENVCVCVQNSLKVTTFDNVKRMSVEGGKKKRKKRKKNVRLKRTYLRLARYVFACPWRNTHSASLLSSPHHEIGYFHLRSG